MIGRRLPTANRWLPQVGIILLLLALDGLIGLGRLPFSQTLLPPPAVLGAAAAIAVLGFTLACMELGIMLLVVIAAAVPFAVGTGTGTDLVASLLFSAFLIVAWMGRMLIHRRLSLAESPINAPLLGFLLVAVSATIYGNVARHPLVWVPATWSLIQAGGLAVFLASAGVLLVAMNVVTDESWVRRTVWIYLAIGAAVLAAYTVRLGRDMPLFSVSGLFSTWVIALASGQALFNQRLPMGGRLGLGLLAAAWYCRRLVLEAGWLSGWVPATAVLAAICFLRSRVLFLIAMAVFLLVALFRYDAFVATEVVGENSGGNFLRLDLWQQNLEVTSQHLMLGTGVVGYAPYYAAFFPDRALSTHSNYLDIFAQTGLVGSFFFVWLLLSLLRVGLQARRRWTEGFRCGFAAAVLAGWFGVVVAMALGDWVIPFVYNQSLSGFRYTVYSWLFFGLLGALQRLPR